MYNDKPICKTATRLTSLLYHALQQSAMKICSWAFHCTKNDPVGSESEVFC